MAYYWVVPVLYAWILSALGYLWMIEEQYHFEIIALFLVGQEQGISVLNKAIAACTEAIEKHKGKLTVKEEPRAVSVTPFYIYIYILNFVTPS